MINLAPVITYTSTLMRDVHMATATRTCEGREFVQLYDHIDVYNKFKAKILLKNPQKTSSKSDDR